MEESLKLINEEVKAARSAADMFSPLTLAFMGDAVFELFIREMLVKQGNRPVNTLHEEAIRYVRAESQSDMVEAVRPMFTEKEEQIYKRGRNAFSKSVPKHATIGQYRRATGFEAVIGWLYLSGDVERALELMQAAARLPLEGKLSPQVTDEV